MENPRINDSRFRGCEKIELFHFTFMPNSEFADCYVIVKAVYEDDAKRKITEVYGDKWAKCYLAEEALEALDLNNLRALPTLTTPIPDEIYK